MLPSEKALRQVQSVVATCGENYPNLALLSNNNLLFNSSRTAFIMYGVEGRTWLAMGDPVAPCDAERRELAWEFQELCERHDGWSVFYQVHPQYLDIYIELGLTALKIGEEARIPLQTFFLQDARCRWLRAALQRCKDKRMHFSVIETGNLSSLLPRLKHIFAAWGHRENGVEAQWFLNVKHDWSIYLLALISEGADITAFAVLRPDNGKRELTLDAIGYLPNASVDVVDYLHLQTILWAKLQGYAWLSLGVTPITDLQDYGLTPLWRCFTSSPSSDEVSYNDFTATANYKEKFFPLWEPRYLMLPAGIALPHILTDMTTLMGRRHKARGASLIRPA
jgi:phosphatidylglycerol lysyltransferase